MDRSTGRSTECVRVIFVTGHSINFPKVLNIHRASELHEQQAFGRAGEASLRSDETRFPTSLKALECQINIVYRLFRISDPSVMRGCLEMGGQHEA